MGNAKKMPIPATSTIGTRKRTRKTILPHQGDNETIQPLIPKTNQKITKEARETTKTNATRKEKLEKQQQQLEYATERKTMISLENGIKSLNIAILNPDSMREATTQQEIVEDLTRNRIRIATIQETHITKDISYLLGNYRVITASADKNATTGVVSG